MVSCWNRVDIVLESCWSRVSCTCWSRVGIVCWNRVQSVCIRASWEAQLSLQRIVRGELWRGRRVEANLKGEGPAILCKQEGEGEGTGAGPKGAVQPTPEEPEACTVVPPGLAKAGSDVPALGRTPAARTAAPAS